MMESTEASIAAFNRTLCRLRLVTLLTLVIAAIALAIAVTGRGPQAEVHARAFVLVDDSGEVLARLVKVKDGPVLVLHARRAGADVLIGSIVDDAGIGINVDGRSRLNLLTGRDGFPSLGIADAKRLSFSDWYLAWLDNSLYGSVHGQRTEKPTRGRAPRDSCAQCCARMSTRNR